MTDQLQMYRDQRQITPAEHAAALIYYYDHRAARSYLEQPRPDDLAVAERYRRASRALGEGRAVVVAVVVDNESASSWAHASGMERAGVMKRLREALRTLAAFYVSEAVEAAE